MKKIISFFHADPIQMLLVIVPMALIAEAWHWNDLVIFSLSALAIIPLAGLIGDSTEALADHTGPRIGGLLNATLGNAAELIITIVAIREGLLELVKASITGSILGNILLVMGMAFVLGGLKNGDQKFNRLHAGRSSILLLLAVITLLVPSILSSSIGPTDSIKVEELSVGVAFVMILLYAASLLYSFRHPAAYTEARPTGKIAPEAPIKEKLQNHKKASNSVWPIRVAVGVLVVATFGVV
jgi:Ca2+:H+ antiporter